MKVTSTVNKAISMVVSDRVDIDNAIKIEAGSLGDSSILYLDKTQTKKLRDHLTQMLEVGKCEE